MNKWEDLGINPATNGAWMFGVYLLMWNLTSLFVGPISSLTSHRWTCSSGIILSGAGIILSNFSKTPLDIILTGGLICGTGMGLIINTCILCVTRHFGDRVGMAIGIMFLVMGLSATVHPFIVHAMRFVPYKIILYGVIMLTGLAGSLMMFEAPGTIERESKNPFKELITLTNWSLMINPRFLLIMLGSSFTFSSLLNYFLLLPIQAKALYLKDSQISALLSVTHSADLVARFIFTWMGDWAIIRRIFGNSTKQMLYALTVIGFSLIMIGKQ